MTFFKRGGPCLIGAVRLAEVVDDALHDGKAATGEFPVDAVRKTVVVAVVTFVGQDDLFVVFHGRGVAVGVVLGVGLPAFDILGHDERYSAFRGRPYQYVVGGFGGFQPAVFPVFAETYVFGMVVREHHVRRAAVEERARCEEQHPRFDSQGDSLGDPALFVGGVSIGKDLLGFVAERQDKVDHIFHAAPGNGHFAGSYAGAERFADNRHASVTHEHLLIGQCDQSFGLGLHLRFFGIVDFGFRNLVEVFNEYIGGADSFPAESESVFLVFGTARRVEAGRVDIPAPAGSADVAALVGDAGQGRTGELRAELGGGGISVGKRESAGNQGMVGLIQVTFRIKSFGKDRINRDFGTGRFFQDVEARCRREQTR